MRTPWLNLARPALGVAGILCWVVMFLAGSDVWKHAGRPDVWRLPGPPYADVRAFLTAYYVLLPVLLFNLLAAVLPTARGLDSDEAGVPAGRRPIPDLLTRFDRSIPGVRSHGPGLL